MSARLRTAPSAVAARSFLLTDWVTVSGGSTVTSVTQDADQWLELPDFAEATFYVDVSQVVNPTGGTAGLVLLYLETAPVPDESLFTSQPLVGPLVCTPQATPYVAKTASAGAVPLSRYVRWRVVATLGASWSVTFRVRVVGNRSTYFAPTSFGNCAFWLRADRGLTFTTAAVTQWADQSGLNDPGRILVAGSSPPTLTVADSSYGGQPTMLFSGNANCYFKNPSSFSPSITHPKTWVLVGHRTSTSGTNYFMDGNSTLAGDAVWDTSTGVITCHSGSPLSSGTGNTWGPTPGGGGDVLLFESDGASSACYLNDFTTALMSGNAGSNTIDSISLGVHSLAFGGGSNWVGPMAEVIAFSATLTTAQKQTLKRYLNNRYGLSIT